MRIYAAAEENDLKTVKAQGERIASAWREKRGTFVQVKAIKRTGNPLKHRQWGFIVLESMFDTSVYHYQFSRGDLTVTHESLLNTDFPEYLECPERFLSMAPCQNSLWRESVRTYQSAIRELTPERVTGDVTLFLKKSYETRQYGEPFFVIQRQGADWFGIDCYSERKFLSLSWADIHAHCPVLIDIPSQRAMDIDNLAPDCVNTGLLIYKQTGDHAVLLGRPKTRAELVREAVAWMNPISFSLHGDCVWS